MIAFVTRRTLATAALVAGLAAAPVAQAQDFNNQIAARQGVMSNLALNLGVLGGMARGNIPYDADAAQVAADNLVAISTLNLSAYWPEGSDSMSVENTRALPTIWDNPADVAANWERLGAAAVALQAVAGTGLEALGPGLGGIGQTCQSCHEDFQEPR